MCSTPLLEAASSSKILYSFCVFSLTDLAKIRAHVVLPTPLGPQKRYACAILLFNIALCRVAVMCFCPTTSLKLAGRYLRADTRYSLM